MKQAAEPLFVGLDVGSTTVKATVLNDNNRILWKDYKRHNAHQSEVTLAFLTRIEEAFPQRSLTIFCTGNGGRAIAPLIGATQVQEVNAVTVAVERLHPHAGSVVELGGQDAKVVIWKTDLTGGKSSISFMNDKCAGGTGATLDKIFARIGISSEQAQALRLEGKTIHHVAAKCGVFAETDVVGLLKAGVPQDEIALSVCTAVVQQNIEVLLHGNVLPDDVLLLGGPHTYLPVFADIWRALLPEVWRLHGYQPANRSLESLIRVPVDAQYFAALGAVFFGRESEAATNAGRTHPTYCGTGPLRAFTEEGKHAHLEKLGNTLRGLVASDEERDQFIAQYASPPFSPPATIPGSTINVWLGIDGGSTSSKLALLSNSGELMYSDYVLSGGNPILDVCRMLENLHHFEQQRDISFHIQGAGVTGYASDLLRIAFCLDAQLVETVAHLKSAVHFHGNVDVICDVGGQDIKVLFMKHGRVVDLRLNTQCSAGNGYFLPGMANQFGVPIESYAEHAFSARKAPSFNCGCAVFMEQDKVNFQQLGWTRDEIMAGLALVLPLNIWNYVVQEANLSRFGTRFLLQGGTQKNLAAVKAQVDFIRNKVPSATVSLHRYAEVAGAIGAAIEVQETRQGIPSTFIGVQNAASVRFSTLNDESTACHFCTNNCPRTFIDICIPGHDPVRHVSGYHCEKGEFTSTAE